MVGFRVRLLLMVGRGVLDVFVPCGFGVGFFDREVGGLEDVGDTGASVGIGSNSTPGNSASATANPNALSLVTGKANKY